MSDVKGLSVRKPGWLRVIGWSAFVCFLIPVVIPLVEITSHYRIPRTVWPGFCLMAFFVLGPVWALGSIIHRAQTHQAKLTAAYLMNAERERQATAARQGGK
jgi:hypothetical protein